MTVLDARACPLPAAQQPKCRRPLHSLGTFQLHMGACIQDDSELRQALSCPFLSCLESVDGPRGPLATHHHVTETLVSPCPHSVTSTCRKCVMEGTTLQAQGSLHLASAPGPQWVPAEIFRPGPDLLKLYLTQDIGAPPQTTGGSKKQGISCPDLPCPCGTKWVVAAL